MTKNIFYFPVINIIGGIETFFYTLARKYQDWDITIYYRQGDQEQIKRLKQYVRVKKFNGERIKCEKAFFNYQADIIDYVDADEYCLILHADYKAQKIKTLPIYPKITKYYGVSQNVCDTFSELSGKEVELAYNPLLIEKPRKVLNLISATRLTPEKGKGRMVELVKALDNAKIPYVWTVYTNDVNAIQNDNIIYRKPRLDIIDYIANADYLVQLSDSEGYAYSLLESLSVGTPVIVTDFPVAKEMGIVNEKNGFILPFDMKDIPINAIYKGLPKFKYTPKPDRWSELLAPGESQYQKDFKINVKIKCVTDYFDLELNRQIKKGEQLEVNKIRAEIIIDAGFADYV